MNIRVTELFSYKTEELLIYLEEEYSKRVKNQFLSKLNNRINTLKRNPKAYPASSAEKGLRKLVITKQTTVFYQISENSIYLITLFDSRQNPAKIKEEIDKYFGS